MSRKLMVGDLKAALDCEPRPDTPLGLSVHIPFCRQRCHFCYFRVYTGKEASAPKVKAYAQELIHELSRCARKSIIGGRKPKYVYFGGGTPSFLSAEQLMQLTDEMKRLLPWDEAEEVAFECEPGTLSEKNCGRSATSASRA